MDIRSLAEATRRGDLRSRFPSCLDRSVREGDVAELAKAVIATHAHSAGPLALSTTTRHAVVEEARAFHLLAGSLTPSVEATLNRLLHENGVLMRVAHTPDFFPYLSVALLPLATHQLASAVSARLDASFCSEIFFLVDCDAASDSRMRSTVLPDASRRRRELRLSTPVPRSLRNKAVAVLAPPSDEATHHLLAALNAHANAYAPSLQERFGVAPHIASDLGVLEQDITHAYAAATSLAEFSGIFLSRLINLHWALPTVFLPQSRVVPHLHSQLVDSLRLMPELASASQSAAARLQRHGYHISDKLPLAVDRPALWIVCRQCGTRTDATLGGDTTVTGDCRGCGATVVIALDQHAPSDSSAAIVMPKVSLDSLLDALVWNFAAGASYMGSAEHVALTLATLAELGLGERIDILWSARAHATHLATLAAGDASMTQRIANGRASILLHLLYEGISAVADTWAAHITAHGLSAPRTNSIAGPR